MKKILIIILMLILTASVAFAETLYVQFEVAANEVTELDADYFIENPQALLLIAVNPDSLADGFIADTTDKEPTITFKPPDMFYGDMTFEYYMLDKNLKEYLVIAHVNVDAIEIDVVNQKVKKSCEQLILSDIQAEYKEIYKQIIELIMMIEPSE